MNTQGASIQTQNGALSKNGALSSNGELSVGHGKESGQRQHRRRGVIKARLLSFLTNAFLGHPRCGCCLCMPDDDDNIPFWTQNETEANNSVNIDYSNETFDSEPAPTHSQSNVSKSKERSSVSMTAKTVRYTENGFSVTSPHVSPNNNIVHKNLESDSEESFSVAPSASETSDTSDVKARIRELSEELKRRKIEAERLKRQHEQKQKEKLKQKEEYLRKQIENYDNYISHVKTELNHGVETPERQGSPVRPQIKPQSHAVTKTTERPKSVDRGRLDLDPSNTTSAAPSVPSRNSKEKPSTFQEGEPEQEILTSSHSKSHDVTKSVSEELIEVDTTAVEESESELKLDLVEKDDDKNQATTPRSVHESRLDTARSVTEIPEDLSVQTDRSEKSHHVSPRLEDIAESPHQLSLKHSETVDETSELSEASHTDKSASYRTESSTYSSKSKSYTDDYSDESESSATISTHTPRSNIPPSEKSTGQTSQVRSVFESKSVLTQDDISESLAEEIQSEEEDESKSEVFFKLTEAPITSQVTDEHQYNVGDRVTVGGEAGTVCFVGFVKYAPGLHAGVALDKPEGHCNGKVEGETYFECEPLHGLLTSVDNVKKLEDELEKSVREDAEKGLDVEVSTKVADVAADEIGDVFWEVDAGEKDSNASPRDVELPDETDDEQSKSRSLKQQSPEVKNEESPKLQPPEAKDEDTEVKARVSKEKECEKATDLAISEPPERSHITNDGHPKPETRPGTGRQQNSTVAPDTQEQLQEEPIQRPVSPKQYESEEFPDDDDDLYDFTNDVEDPWNDDDLGFGISRNAPPSQPGVVDTDELKLDLSKLTEPIQPERVLYVVPHSEPQVRQLVSTVVDLFWERRRYGESWHDVEPPSSYFTVDPDVVPELELHSSRVYKKLVFDLTAHVLRDMYQDEDDDRIEQPPWLRQSLAKFKYHKRPIPPTTVDSLRPIVQRHVGQLLGVSSDVDTDRCFPTSASRRWNARKKKDRVDEILVQELRQDEPQWVDYDTDELAVKMQIADTLFESLMADTVGALRPVLGRWSQGPSSSSSTS